MALLVNSVNSVCVCVCAGEGQRERGGCIQCANTKCFSSLGSICSVMSQAYERKKHFVNRMELL